MPYICCALIYDLKLQLIFVNFSVYSFEYYFMPLFLIILKIILIKCNNNKNNTPLYLVVYFRLILVE